MPAGTDAVPVYHQAWRLFQVVAALVAATAVSSRPTPRPTATVRMTSRVTASRPPLIPSRSPSGDHGWAPVSVLTLPSLTMTSRSA